MSKTVEIPGLNVSVTLKGKGGVITTSGPDWERSSAEESGDYERYNAALNALPSIVLAHACAGVDIAASEYAEGVRTALDAIANNEGSAA